MNLEEKLKWRYATKKFDVSKKITNAKLENLKENIRLSASSFGLQLYTILIIEDEAIKEELKAVSYGQEQITDCSHLFVFCNYTNPNNGHVDEYLQLKADAQSINSDNLKGYGSFIKETLSYKSDDEKKHWTEKQTYIALSNLLVASAELKIDSCPMEGFQPEKYNEILGITKSNLNASVIVATGYRSEEDQTQFALKVRKSKEELFITI